MTDAATTDTTATTEKVDATATTATTATTTPADTGTKTLADGATSTDTKTADTTTADTTATTTAAEKNWRDELAGEDKDFRKRLERFTKPDDFSKSYRALETKLSSGEYRKTLPEKATPEEVATWRKENGIPDKPEGYVEKLALPNGMVLGEEDKPVINAFAQMAQGKNWSPAQYNDAVSWYYETQNKLAGDKQKADHDFMSTAEDTLRTTWGADYRRNMNVIGSIRDTMPEGLRDRLMAGRTADGRMIGNDPEMLGWLVSLGRELNPAATLLPAGGSDPVKGVADELAEIRKLRTNDPNAYESDKKLQAREIELIDAQLKMKSRAA